MSEFRQGGERVRVVDATLNFPFGTAYQKPAYFGDCLCEVILDDGRWIQARRSCIRPVRPGVGACRVALTPPFLEADANAAFAAGHRLPVVAPVNMASIAAAIGLTFDLAGELAAGRATVTPPNPSHVMLAVACGLDRGELVALFSTMHAWGPEVSEFTAALAAKLGPRGDPAAMHAYFCQITRTEWVLEVCMALQSNPFQLVELEKQLKKQAEQEKLEVALIRLQGLARGYVARRGGSTRPSRPPAGATRPASLRADWPKTTRGLSPAKRSRLIANYKAEVAKCTPKEGMEHLLYGRTPGFLSLRKIRATMPLIDRCDFLALLVFEDGNPHLFEDAEEIPARRDDMLDPVDYIRQADAFHRVWTHPEHSPQFKELIRAYHDERDQARARFDDGNRFTNNFMTSEAVEDMQERARSSNARAIVCSSCAATRVEPGCEGMTLMSLSKPLCEVAFSLGEADTKLVICDVAQQLIARASAGRTPKVKLADGSKVAMCAGCGERLDGRGKKLLACARCKNAIYCGKDCQKKAWKTHKKYCRAPGDASRG